MSNNFHDFNKIYITAILPAHNEEKSIAKAIDSIRAYVNTIIVACDNCSDYTAEKARKAHADIVFNTFDNHHRKAGALNQALDKYVDWRIRNQYLLIMDADTVVIKPQRWFSKAESLIYPNRLPLSRKARDMSHIERDWLRITDRKQYDRLFNDRAYDCVGSIFEAPRHLAHHNFLTEGQRLEWEGYASKIERTRKVFVLTGTCSLFSANVLKRVYKRHHYKYFYNDRSLTEDFFMTLSLKECHARLISPTTCVCTTATKNTIFGLMRQRRRWYAGALQAINSTNVDIVTLPYWGQQIMLFISTFAFLLFLLVSLYIYLTFSVDLTFFWSVIFIGFDINQMAKGWKYGSWIDRLYAASMIGCLCYSLVLQMSYIWALYTFVEGKHVYWNNHQQDKSSVY